MSETIGPVLIALILIALELNAAVAFLGKTKETGDLSLGCGNISKPSKIKAEDDSYKQARVFCDTFSLRPNRVGEFTYNEQCEIVENGLSKHFEKTLSATADYNCI